MDETGFIHKQKYRKIVVSKGSSNLWSNCDDTNIHMNFVVCVSAAKYIAPQLLILHIKRLNRDVLEGFYI